MVRRRGRDEARGARFANRYPVVLLVPLSALFLGLSAAYAGGLAGSWSVIHGAKVAAVVAGAAVGLAVAIAAVIGGRGGNRAWMLLPGVVVIVGFLVTRQQIAPVNTPGKITTPFEAAVFALCSVVWALSGITFLGLLPRFWRARKAFSRQERSLHITRAQNWREASSAPVSVSEWRQFAESRSDLTAYDPRDSLSSAEQSLAPLADARAARRLAVRERQARTNRDLIATRPDLIARNPDLAQWLPPGFPINTFACKRDDGSQLYLTWFNGEIVVAGVGRDRAADVARVQSIAWALGAHLVDDDGTIYEPE